MKVVAHLVLCSLVALAASACAQQEEPSKVPHGYVGFIVDTAVSGSDNSLRDGMAGNAKYYSAAKPAALSPTGGYGYCGVIVVRAYDNLLYAFDSCCPYECSKDAEVVLDGFFAVCPVCGSSFEIGNGSARPNKGPATARLKCYRVTDYGNQRWRISN